jgi:D-aminopeptidase
MRERNIEVVVVDDGDQARKVVLERLPEGAEVHSGKSKTL